MNVFRLPVGLMRLALSGASAFALWYGSLHTHIWLFTIAGLAFLWLALRRASLPRAFFWGTFSGFIYFYLCFDWAYEASGMVGARIALSLLEALFIGVTGMLWAGLWRVVSHHKHWWSVVVMLICSGGAWAGMEIVRSYVPFGGLPWSLLGYSLVDSPFIHLAPLGSTELVAASAVMCAILVVVAIGNVVTFHPLRALTAGVLCISLMVLPLCVSLEPSSSERSLRVGIVQGNAPELSSPDAENWSVVTTQNHVTAAESILDENPDVIILPESTSQSDYRTDNVAHELISGLARTAGVPLLLGTQRYFSEHVNDAQGEEPRRVRTNDYVVQYPHTDSPSADDTYSKQRPVPFGEYIPMRPLFENFSRRLDEISIDMVAGDKPAQLRVDLDSHQSVTVAVPICFEVAYSRIVSEAAQGSDLLIIPTSNVSFGYSSEAHQQFLISRFRAAENGRTAIQVSTTGISGAIRPDGSVIYQTGLFESDARVLDIPLYDGVTLAASSYGKRTGITVAVLALSIAVTGAACAAWPKRRMTRRN